MAQQKDTKDVAATDAAAGGGGGGVSLGKGAWDCDNNVAIPPEAEVSSYLFVVIVEMNQCKAVPACSFPSHGSLDCVHT